MMKRKCLVIFFIMIVLILNMSNILSATTDYATIIRGNDNQWIKFPSSITKSWMANWDGYYTYSGTINKISTSENVTFQIQYSCIEKEYVDEIQEHSDQMPNDNEFKEWLNNYAIDRVDEDEWINLTNMKINLECILGENVEHEHLVFVKVLENNTESIVWQGYGAGFSRITESRKKVYLERIEISTPPSKTVYDEGEYFDTTGMVITAKYSDGSSKVVTNYTYSPKAELNTTDTEITIVYTENNISKEAKQLINVKSKSNEDNNNDDDTPPVILEGIEITTPPSKTVYDEGEYFDTTGMVITAKYSDGSSKVVTNYTYSPKAELNTTDTEITIVYTENNVSKEANQGIKVIEKEDSTTVSGNIPNAGDKLTIMFILTAMTIIGIVIYSRYRKMKDIL